MTERGVISNQSRRTTLITMIVVGLICLAIAVGCLGGAVFYVLGHPANLSLQQRYHAAPVCEPGFGGEENGSCRGRMRATVTDWDSTGDSSSETLYLVLAEGTRAQVNLPRGCCIVRRRGEAVTVERYLGKVTAVQSGSTWYLTDEHPDWKVDRDWAAIPLFFTGFVFLVIAVVFAIGISRVVTYGVTPWPRNDAPAKSLRE